MNVSELFIRRPVATILLMAGIAMFGALAYLALPVSDLPTVDYPTLSVSASLPGADPSTMASAVATPLERQFTTIAGVDSMTSTNSLGSSQITLQFDLARKIDGAAVDVQTAIAEAMPLLPPGMPAPPSFRKVNPADMPILFFALTSKTLPKWVLDEYAESVIAQRISGIDGVAQVQVMGAQKYAVHVQVDPDKLAALKIGINEVGDALRNWNVNIPTGTLWGPHQAFNVRANGQLENASRYQNLIVTYRNGAAVRLKDIAIVRDGTEDERTAGWIFTRESGGVPAINLMVMRQPGSNVIEVTDSIKKAMPTITAQLPPTVKLEIRSDRSKSIREAFSDVQITLAITMGLVIMVIFLFLRKGSATLIPSLALPFSLIGTFAVMYLLNFSMDSLSMMAIILCVGFVVDDAIVMLENIVRHIERGEKVMEAALRGSREIWFTIISMTVSLAAVFIPILFMGGILGRLFREFAVTICAAILISGFVSVSLTPMLCSRLLRPHEPEGQNALSRFMEKMLHGFTRGYDVSLQWVLAHRSVMIVVFVVMLGATAGLFTAVPKGFIPETDNDQIMCNTEAAQGTSFEAMKGYQLRVANILWQDQDIDALMTSVGGGMFGASNNTGRLWIQLKPRRDRKATAAEIVARLRPRISNIPGIKTYLSLPAALRVGGRMSKSSYELTLQSPDTALLYREAARLEREVAKLPSVLDVNSDIQMRSPRVRIDVDRDKAAAYGLTTQAIEQAIYDGYGPSWASTIYAPTNQFRVMLEVQSHFQEYADMLPHLYMKADDGRLIPLQEVTHRVEDVGPQSINHSGQLPSVTVSFNLKPGVSLGSAVDEVNDLLREKLPSTISVAFSGTAKVFQDSLSNLGLLLLVAILVVYIVLGVLYESFIHPITILSGLPSAAFGALLILLIFQMELNIYGFVGLILLIGLVKKNAIMQIDFAIEAQRRTGASARDAIYLGCLARFRPILMTTMAALLGSIPIATGWGSGGEARRPMGLVVIGGMLFSQAITLYLTPVVYTYLDGLNRGWSWRRGRAAVPQPQPSEVHP